MRQIYVAGPFSSDDNWELANHVMHAKRIGFELAKLGASICVPHALGQDFDRTLTYEFWIAMTQHQLATSNAIMMLDGWKDSNGSRGELELAVSLDFPIFFERDLHDACAREALKKWIETGIGGERFVRKR